MNFPKRFHILSLPHTISSEEFNACAYTMKVVNWCKMMKPHGHHIIHYGVEGANVEASEIVDLLSRKELDDFYGYDKEGHWKNKQFSHNGKNGPYIKFNSNGIEELKKRILPGDFVLTFFGNACYSILKSIENEKDVFIVEPGIGYDSGFCKYRVYESHSIMAYTQGKKGSQHPPHHHTVIPNYFDLSHFDPPTKEENGEYWLVLGRMITCKGGDVAFRAAVTLNEPIVYAGQGSLVDIGVDKNHHLVTDVGYVNVEQRRNLFKKAKGLIIQSRYLEPFGGVAAEAMLSGVPVIAANRGAFPELIREGVSGFLSCDLTQLIGYMIASKSLNRQAIRDYAISKFSFDRVSNMYNEYFTRIFLNHFFRSDVVSHPLNGVKYNEAYIGKYKYNIQDNTKTRLIIGSVPELNKELCNEENEHGILTKNSTPSVVDYFPIVLSENKSDEYNIKSVQQLSRIIKPKSSCEILMSDYSFNIICELLKLLTPDKLIWLHPDECIPDIPKYTLREIEGDRAFFERTVEQVIPKKDVTFNTTEDIIEPEPERKIKVALWTRPEWAFGRIAQGLQKYTKKCEITIVDWGNIKDNIKFWKHDWKNYDVITGNAAITSFPWKQKWVNPEDEEEIIKKLRPTIHAPANHKYYTEELDKVPLAVSGVSSDVVEYLQDFYKKTNPNIPIFQTVSGVDINIFKNIYRPNQVKVLGFIGQYNYSDDVEEVKRSKMFQEIADRGGYMTKYINGRPLSEGVEMYDDIDVLICTSKFEGGPLGYFEAISSGCLAISTKVGAIKNLNGMLTFDTVDEALEILDKFNGDPQYMEEYRQAATNFVRTEMNWNKAITAWDSFFTEDIESLVIKESAPMEDNTKNESGKPIADSAVMQFAHAMKKPCKLSNGEMYDPSLHPENEELGRIRPMKS